MRAKRMVLEVALWFYGLSVTAVLISVWGQAVVADVEGLQSAAVDFSGSQMLVDRVERMLIEEAEKLGAEVPDLGDLSEDQAISEALSGLAVALVQAASLPAGEVATVDTAAYLRPVSGAITSRMQENGLDVGEDQVIQLIDRLDSIDVKPREAPPLVGPASKTSRTLGVATVVALAVVVLAGGLTMRLVEEPRRQLRSLLTRVAVSATSFAIITGVSAWLLDPAGGRAPVRRAASGLLASKVWIPVVFAILFGIFAWLWRSRVRPGEVSPPTSEPPTPPTD